MVWLCLAAMGSLGAPCHDAGISDGETVIVIDAVDEEGRVVEPLLAETWAIGSVSPGPIIPNSLSCGDSECEVSVPRAADPVEITIDTELTIGRLGALGRLDENTENRILLSRSGNEDIIDLDLPFESVDFVVVPDDEGKTEARVTPSYVVSEDRKTLAPPEVCEADRTCTWRFARGSQVWITGVHGDGASVAWKGEGCDIDEDGGLVTLEGPVECKAVTQPIDGPTLVITQ
ncbi:MAG: hypothetical protein AAF602_28675, partial [Myxococcota bacterium]